MEDRYGGLPFICPSGEIGSTRSFEVAVSESSCGFKSHLGHQYVGIAQLVEHSIDNRVGGDSSSPIDTRWLLMGKPKSSGQGQ